MAYRVDLTERAARDLRRIYLSINAVDGARSRTWFNGLERAVLSLEEQPARTPHIPEGGDLRHLPYGRMRFRYRIIYEIVEADRAVTVLHIRHGARDAFGADEPDDDNG